MKYIILKSFWFPRKRSYKNLTTPIQVLILIGVIFVLSACYLALAKYISPPVASLLSFPLKLSQDITSSTRQFLNFEDLTRDNKSLRAQLANLNGQLIRLEEARKENQRLRNLLSLPQRPTYKTQTALLIGKDSSNWTKTILVNKGSKSGIKKGMPVVVGGNLVGKVIEAYPMMSKISLLIDFDAKIPAKNVRTREDGIVFGCLEVGRNICKMKYIHEVEKGDKIISSGLGQIYPQGLLIGEVIKVEEAKNKLYQLAEIQPAVDFSKLEEVMIITGFGE